MLLCGGASELILDSEQQTAVGNTSAGDLTLSQAAHHKVQGRADFRQSVNEVTLIASRGFGSY